MALRIGSVATLLAIVALTGCGGGNNQPTGLDSLRSLRGQSIGLVTLDGVPSLELRYVLQKGAGLNSKALGGEVRYASASADSLPDMLQQGEVSFALLSPQVAFSLKDEPRFQVRARIAAAMRDLTGSPVISTALLTPRDEANRRPAALTETRRMLLESTAYLRSNQTKVLNFVANDRSLDSEYVRWLSERQHIVIGESSRGVQEELVALWAAAVEMGDIPTAPNLGDVLFRSQGGDRKKEGRETVSIAVLDDALHRGALHAIEQGFVRSDEVDLAVTYLSPSALGQAIAAREYDVVEASPLLVATGRRTRLDLVVLSGSVEDIDATSLFDYVAAR